MKNAKLVFALISSLALPMSGFAADYDTNRPGSDTQATEPSTDSSSSQSPAMGGTESSQTPGTESSQTPSSSMGGTEGQGRSGSFMFDELDANKDGYINSREARRSAAAQGEFRKLDSDSDGNISRDEWKSGGYQ